jgi:uncharacterized membrane protein
LPHFDPNKNRYSEFSDAYHGIKNSVVVLFAILYGLIGAESLGFSLGIHRTIPLALGLFYILLGYYLPSIKPNWFVGIRTPWMLSNEVVWTRTHQLGGKIMTIAGAAVIIITVINLPEKLYLSCIIGILTLSAVIPAVYSFWLFKKQK